MSNTHDTPCMYKGGFKIMEQNLIEEGFPYFSFTIKNSHNEFYTYYIYLEKRLRDRVSYIIVVVVRCLLCKTTAGEKLYTYIIRTYIIWDSRR